MRRVFRKKLSRATLRAAAVCVALFAAVASVLFMVGAFPTMRLNPFEKIELNNILTAQTDAAGDTYIIDSGMNRVVKMNADGVAEYEITGGSADTVFYNAYDVAAEGASLFVHDVAWDDSGMSIAYERILEFDKRAGALRRELYWASPNDSAPGRNLPELPRLRLLRFADGKLWFTRKSKSTFVVYSLVPGENLGVEYVVPYKDALRTLDDFAADIAGGRIFFVDKAGVVRVFADNEIRIVFNPVSGTSARDFSLPYRLSFDGADLYFSDIGKRAVLRVEGQNKGEDKAEIVFGGWGSVSGDIPPLYYSVHAGDGLLTLAGVDSVLGIASGGNEVFRASSLPAGGKIMLLRLCFWASALVLLSLLLFAAAAAFRWFWSGGRASAKEGLSLPISVSIVSTFIAVTPTFLAGNKSLAEGEIMNRLSYIMEMSAEVLDTEALAEIETPQDYDGAAYRKFKSSLDKLVERNNEWNRRIFCNVFKFKDGLRYSVCFLDETIGAFFDPTDIRGSDAQIAAGNGEWVEHMERQDVSGSYMFLSGPIRSPDGSVGGEIEIGVEMSSLRSYISALSRNLIVRILLMLALALFFVSEIVEYIPLAKARPENGGDGEISSRNLRLLTFAVFLAFNLSMAFLPNYALKMEGSFPGFSRNISAVLPITVCDLAMTLAPLIVPSMIARLGRLSFVIGFVLCALGYAVCSAAATIGLLVAGMGVLGLGAGVLFTLLHICIASRKSVEERTLDFSSFTSASFSGINCGILTGGIVATNFGQKAVFSFGFCLWASILAAFLLVTRKKTGMGLGRAASVPNRAVADRTVADRTVAAPRRLPLVFPTRILCFLFLLFLPFMMHSGFMYYLVPVFGSQAGFSDTEISLVFLFFGTGILLLGPKVMASALGESAEISHFLWLTLIMELFSILCFAFFQSTAAMLAAVLILGGAYGIGGAYFPLYLTEMPESKALGESGGMAFFNFTESLGLIAAPVIFNVIFNAGGSLGYYVLAALMFFSSLLYPFIRIDSAEAHR
jgi:MFS family permease